MINENIIKSDIKKYIDSNYGDVKIFNMDDKNLCFDLYIHGQNINQKIEYKTRDFKTDKNIKYLFEHDLLVELFQGVYEFNKIPDIITNKNINNYTSAKRINTMIGWFYKCNANRLFYLRYLDDQLYDIIDIDFIPFKDWLFNNFYKYKLNWCGLTTGTINLIIKLSDIPKNMINYKKGQL